MFKYIVTALFALFMFGAVASEATAQTSATSRECAAEGEVARWVMKQRQDGRSKDAVRRDILRYRPENDFGAFWKRTALSMLDAAYEEPLAYTDLEAEEVIEFYSELMRWECTESGR